MININDFHLTILDLLNKNNAQYVAPQEIDRFINLASSDYFNEIAGAKTIRKVVYGKDRILDRRLNPFRETVTLDGSNGSVAKPAGLELILSVSTIAASKPKPLREVDEQRWDKLFDNPLAEPTAEDPAFSETKNTLQVSPANGSIKIQYLRTPIKAKWAYTLSNGRTPVYDPISSIDLDWDESERPQLLMRTANYLGLDIRDSAVVQFTDKEKTQQI